MIDMGQSVRISETTEAAVAAVLQIELAERKAAGHPSSVPWLAEASGVPYGTLRRYHAGKRGSDLDVIFKVAHALGMSGAHFLSLVEARLPESTPRAGELEVQDDDRAAPDAHLPGEARDKLDILVRQLHPKPDTGATGTGVENRSLPPE